jgi:hypothetical protein
MVSALRRRFSALTRMFGKNRQILVLSEPTLGYLIFRPAPDIHLLSASYFQNGHYD